MTPLPLQRSAIEPRIDGIQRDLIILQEYAAQPFEVFEKNALGIDQVLLRLRYALEGVFHVGAHILSRIPGGRFTEYKEIARKLGEYAIVPDEFAEAKLVPMAGYRNRLTHLYAQISPKELHAILNTNLSDIEEYLGYIKKVLSKPEKFNLTIE